MFLREWNLKAINYCSDNEIKLLRKQSILEGEDHNDKSTSVQILMNESFQHWCLSKTNRNINTHKNVCGIKRETDFSHNRVFI